MLTKLTNRQNIAAMKDKVNEVIDTVNQVNTVQTVPSATQTIREDFAYYTGFHNDLGNPSIYFKYSNYTSDGSQSAGYSALSGRLDLTATCTDGGQARNQLLGTELSLNNLAGEEHYFETRVLASAGDGSTHPALETAFGFSGVLNANAGPESKFGVLFTFNYGANSGSVSSPTVTAVVYNNQSPTPSVIFSSVISGSFGNVYTSPAWNVFGIRLTTTKAIFYVNGTQVAEFSSGLFSTPLIFRPYLSSTCFSEDGYFGDGASSIDYIAVLSNLVR